MKRYTQHTVNKFLNTDLTPYEYRFSWIVMDAWLDTQTDVRDTGDFWPSLRYHKEFKQEIWTMIWPDVQRNDWIRWRVGSMENKAIRHWLKARGNTSEHIKSCIRHYGYYYSEFHNNRPSDHKTMESYMASGLLGNPYVGQHVGLQPFDRANMR